MKYNLFLRNPYLLFLPFLIVFLIYILLYPTDGASGDQLRYLTYAHNLTHGYYAPPLDFVWLINGPGYPIILVPFLALELPLITITILNAFFFYFSIILLFKSLKELVSFNLTVVFSFAWACYTVAYGELPYIYTESFTYLLVTLLIYAIVKLSKQSKSNVKAKYIVLAGFTLGYIVLTKMIFGYVILFLVSWHILLWVSNTKNFRLKKGLIITTISLLTTAPYLVYTYNLTDRLFFWGMGNDSLYWMTSPSADEYGDWTEGLIRNPTHYANYNIYGADSILVANHQLDFNELNKYKGIERNDKFKELALRNIKDHPLKYAQNIIYNIGRLVFNYPHSQAIQKPKYLLIFLFNGILLTFTIFSLIPTILNWKKFPFHLKFLLNLVFLYLGASAIVSASVRMFSIIVPILLLWIAFIFQNTVKVNFKFREDK